MVLLNIDTAKDSPDEIRKTIRYLQSLVDEEPATPAPPPSQATTLDGMEVFHDEQAPAPAAEEASAEEPKPSGAEQLLKEADEETEIEVEDNKDAFIEIVDLDDESSN